jgi:hypothetical protein
VKFLKALFCKITFHNIRVFMQYHVKSFSYNVSYFFVFIYIYFLHSSSRRLRQGQRSRYSDSSRAGDRIQVQARFFVPSDWPPGPPSLLYNGYRVFPGVKRQGVMLSNCCLLAPCCEWFGGIPTPAVCATYACHGVIFYQYKVLFVTIPYYIHL